MIIYCLPLFLWSKNLGAAGLGGSGSGWMSLSAAIRWVGPLSSEVLSLRGRLNSKVTYSRLV